MDKEVKNTPASHELRAEAFFSGLEDIGNKYPKVTITALLMDLKYLENLKEQAHLESTMSKTMGIEETLISINSQIAQLPKVVKVRVGIQTDSQEDLNNVTEEVDTLKDNNQGELESSPREVDAKFARTLSQQSGKPMITHTNYLFWKQV